MTRRTGDNDFRRRGSGNAWVTSSRGWLQDRWPQVAVDKCPGLNLRGLVVDERQTGTSLAALRRQAPDAPLKNLVQPLPPPVSKQGAPAKPVSAVQEPYAIERQLSDELMSGAKEHALAFMGEAYADRRFVFIGDGSLVVVDRDGNLAAGEGFEGSWRWAAGRLELRVAGDRSVHSIARRDLARELGMAAPAAGG